MTMTSKLSGIRESSGQEFRAETGPDRRPRQARAQPPPPAPGRDSGRAQGAAMLPRQGALVPGFRHQPGGDQGEQEEAREIPEEAALHALALEPEADILRRATKQRVRHRIG